MSRIMILGAGGMLGHKLCGELEADELIGVVRQPAARYARHPGVFSRVKLVDGVDVLAGDALERVVSELRPDVVINCVGIVKQLEAAEDPIRAISINSLLPHRLARACAESRSRLIHISTDCVFDGERGGYREEDLRDARDFYGRSKALGETGNAQSGAVTLRTSFIGHELADQTHGLVEWFLSKEGGSVDGFANVIYSGLTSLELSRVVQLLIDRHTSVRGLFQVASKPISKYNLLLLIKEIYGLDIDIRKVSTPVSDRSMIAEKFQRATGYQAPSWPEMIRAMHQDAASYPARRRELQV